MRLAARVSLVGMALCAGMAACSALLDLQPPPVEDSGAGPDVSMGMPDSSQPSADVLTNEAAADAGADAIADASPNVDSALTCTALDAATAVGDASVLTTWNPLPTLVINDAGLRSWQPFDMSTVVSTAVSYQGAAFDGQYIYFAPTGSNPVMRYNTQGPYFALSSWSSFLPSSLTPAAEGFSGAVFDGKYITFVPASSSAAYAGTVVRYSISGSFTSPSSWTSYNILPVAASDAGFLTYRGGSFDGRYVYMAPYGAPSGKRQGHALRYDTQGQAMMQADAGADADAAGGIPPGWSTYNTAAQNASAMGFSGSVFDGQYVYLVPYSNAVAANGGYSGWLTRFDTADTFTNAAAWSYFDTSSLPAAGSAFGFQGAVFDGRYIYLVPDRETVVTRYDTQGGFTSFTSYTKHDLGPIIGPDASADATHFATGAFDGRYVYFIPSFAGFGTLVRYDTQSDFDLACAWQTYDLTQLNGQAQNFSSVVYDGEYLYLVPFGSVVMRFDTKNPPSMPGLPGFKGSFY